MALTNHYRYVVYPFPHPTRIMAVVKTFREGDKKLISERVVKIVKYDDNGIQAVKKSTLYFAAPLDIHPETPIYRKALLAAQRRWPFHTIFEPLAQDWDTPAWLEAWPDVLSNIDVLTVLPRSDGSIGMGCHREIVDCRDRDIPIFSYVYNDNEYRTFIKVLRVSSKHRNPNFYAFLHPHSKPGYWKYSDDELSRDWVESNSERREN